MNQDRTELHANSDEAFGKTLVTVVALLFAACTLGNVVLTLLFYRTASGSLAPMLVTAAVALWVCYCASLGYRWMRFGLLLMAVLAAIQTLPALSAALYADNMWLALYVACCGFVYCMTILVMGFSSSVAAFFKTVAQQT